MFLNQEKYGYYIIPEWVTFNPGALVIYDASKGKETPLFTILKDGRIFSGWDTYTLRYTTTRNIITFELWDELNKIQIARLLLNADGNFVIE